MTVGCGRFTQERSSARMNDPKEGTFWRGALGASESPQENRRIKIGEGDTGVILQGAS